MPASINQPINNKRKAPTQAALDYSRKERVELVWFDWNGINQPTFYKQ